MNAALADTPRSTAPLELTPLSRALGAIVEGVALADVALDDACFATLEAALLEHQVLFFHRQSLSPRQQRDLAARFGALHVHPIYPSVADVPEVLVLDTDADNPPDNDNWHTDVTFIEQPPLGAVLVARQLPPCGGDTPWASGSAAFAALSPPLQGFLAGLSATHDFVRSFPAERHSRTPEERTRWETARARHPPVTHPVVRTHPVTGRRGLFVNAGFTTRINELAPRESEHLLAFLHAHLARPEFNVRWRWETGDVAIWDNRLTQHYALADYLPARRVMHRATILGDRPY